MTKRIIDSMSSQEIVDGLLSAHDGYKLVKIEDYIHQICKPMPNWEDDVRLETPVLCWVGESLEDIQKRWEFAFICTINALDTGFNPYQCTIGAFWKHARPISPNECWQPAKQGEADEDNA